MALLKEKSLHAHRKYFFVVEKGYDQIERHLKLLQLISNGDDDKEKTAELEGKLIKFREKMTVVEPKIQALKLEILETYRQLANRGLNLAFTKLAKFFFSYAELAYENNSNEDVYLFPQSMVLDCLLQSPDEELIFKALAWKFHKHADFETHFKMMVVILEYKDKIPQELRSEYKKVQDAFYKNIFTNWKLFTALCAELPEELCKLMLGHHDDYGIMDKVRRKFQQEIMELAQIYSKIQSSMPTDDRYSEAHHTDSTSSNSSVPCSSTSSTSAFSSSVRVSTMSFLSSSSKSSSESSSEDEVYDETEGLSVV